MVEPAILTTPRLVLRPVEFGDHTFIFERAIDPEFARFLPLWPEQYTLGDAQKFVLSMIQRSWDDHPTFVITLAGRPIGDVGIRVDETHNVAEMGWGIAREHWGQGYMTEAAGAAMSWAFDTFALAKVLARCDAENIASWRVMEKLAMQREGHLRSQRLLRGQRRDELVYGKVRDTEGHESA